MGVELLAKGIHLLAWAFFLGLIGCGVTIVLSWIDILGEGFTKEPDSKIPE